MKASKIIQQNRRKALIWLRSSSFYKGGFCAVAQKDLALLPSRHVCKAAVPTSRNLSVVASKPDDNTKSEIAPTSSNESHLHSLPIDFEIAATIEGDESHIATIELQPGETLRAESGAMLYMTDGIEMETKMEGMSSAFSRMLTGQNLFFTDFRYTKETGSGTVCLGTDFPSKILRFSLDAMPNGSLICQKGAYLASNPSVAIEMEFTKSFTAGFFGGEGFVLQKLSGGGDVLVKGGGTIVRRTLNEGEVLRATSGSLVAFESTVNYDVQMVQGISNAMFGGEGLFITTLTGPGTVWLQGMPPDRMIAEIARRVPSGSRLGIGIPIGAGGGEGASGADAAAGSADQAAGGISTAGAADSMGTGVTSGVAGSTAATSESLAAEEAIQADRNATVATSGIDSESPSALFGDAAPRDDSPSTASNANFFEDNQTSSNEQDPFGVNQTSEPTFQDDEVYDGSSSNSVADGELFNDSPEGSTSSVDDGEGSGGLFQTLWDIFSGGDE